MGGNCGGMQCIQPLIQVVALLRPCQYWEITGAAVSYTMKIDLTAPESNDPILKLDASSSVRSENGFLISITGRETKLSLRGD